MFRTGDAAAQSGIPCAKQENVSLRWGLLTRGAAFATAHPVGLE